MTTISVDPAHVIAPVDDRLYSGFIEHLGRCKSLNKLTDAVFNKQLSRLGIYGGIVPDPETPKDLITPSGFRKDVLHLLRDELKVPIVRWPGGNFVRSVAFFALVCISTRKGQNLVHINGKME
jgi:alpha-N-arabinofuranosidase